MFTYYTETVEVQRKENPMNVYVFRVPNDVGRALNRQRWLSAELYAMQQNPLPVGHGYKEDVFEQWVRDRWETLTDKPTPANALRSYREPQRDMRGVRRGESFKPYPYGGAIIVLDETTGEAAVSVCSLYDQFDENIGEQVALNRLDTLTPEENRALLEFYVPQWNHPKWTAGLE